MCVCVCVCVYQTLHPNKCDTKPILKPRATGFNTKFSFSKTGFYTNVLEPCLSLPIIGGRIAGFILFPM